MSNSPAPENTPVPPEMYDRTYYLEAMEGAEAFARSGGRELSERLAYPVRLAHLQPGQRVLDLACGRGEVTWHCAGLGVEAHGLDYAAVALEIAAGLKGPEGVAAPRFLQASAYFLPYATASFDTVFMLDIVEHLYPDELLATFKEVHRVLKPGGRLIAHTMPNEDYYRFGYPIYRLVMRLAGRKLPRDARQRFYHGDVHVNIQNPRGLRRTLAAAGFDPLRVWLEPINGGPLQRRLTNLWPVRHILVNDIVGIAVRP